MLSCSLIVVEQDGGTEAATSKIEKGEVENGIHWTGSPCWCIRNVVNGTVFCIIDENLRGENPSGAAERTATWDPRLTVRNGGIYKERRKIPGI